MNHATRLLTAAGAGLWVASAALSQPTPTLPPTQTRPLQSAAGRAALSRLPDGELWGSGNGYLVKFEPEALSFRPVLGSGVAPEFRFTLESVGRRSSAQTTLTPVGAAVCSHAERTVKYTRPQVIETYEVRAEGVEQSFTFAALPPGEGDLVVRGRLGTSLTLPPAQSARTLSFTGSDHGVHLGAVTGIDAHGARAEGWLAVCDGMLELGLPSAFVEHAALPLVLDPLIGTVTAVTASGSDPDVAYDASTGTYLVVYEDGSGASAQRIDRVGARVGAPIVISQSSTWGGPRVANVKVRSGFVVVWTTFPSLDVHARWVDAASGATSPALAVAATGDWETNPQVGGEATSADDDVLAVWTNEDQNRIEACQIQVSPTGTLTILTPTTIYTGTPGARAPAISRSGGATGRHLIVWHDFGRIHAMPVDRNLAALAPTFLVSSISATASNPAVDGDGTSWVVAYETEATAGSGDRDIACHAVTLESSGIDLGPQVIIEGDVGDDEITPSVSWNGGSCLVGFSDERGAAYDAHVKSIDPRSCNSCEGGSQLDPASTFSNHVRIASELSGDPTASVDKALIVWADQAAQSVSYVGYRSDDGVVTNLGGQCGNGGKLLATCARAGFAGFGVRVTRAQSSSAAFLVLAMSPASLACGPCTLVPDLFTGFVFSAGNTDANGDAQVSIPLPSGLPPTLFYAQWAIVTNAPACSRLGVDLSPAAQVLTQ